mgnify:CR=1 FL=1
MKIQVSSAIKLQKITLNDQGRLYNLMKEIYIPAYHHLWEDGGEWYLDTLYSKENLKKELLEKKQEYYFVLYDNEIIGIFRILLESPLDIFPQKKALMLQRIYLHHNTHGKGIAKQLLDWLENLSKESNHDIIWLKAMDTQKQALRFYIKRGFIKAKNTSLSFPLLFKDLRGMYIMYKDVV